MAEPDIIKLEEEVSSLEKSFGKARGRIWENGGRESSFWAFQMRGRVADAKKKIAEIKTGKIRIDKLTPEETDLEKQLINVETKLGIKSKLAKIQV